MRRFHFVLTLIIAASVGTAGCASSPELLTSPSSVGGASTLAAHQLAGTWQLESLQIAGREEAKPAGPRYTLTFTDGRFSTLADCNVCNGGFALSGETLTAGPVLACTRAACPTMAFESAYTGVLGGDSTVTLSGGRLVLSSSRGVLEFTR